MKKKSLFINTLVLSLLVSSCGSLTPRQEDNSSHLLYNEVINRAEQVDSNDLELETLKEEYQVDNEVFTQSLEDNLEEETPLDEKITIHILGKVYALLAIDLSSLGFELYSVVDTENKETKGLAYADYSKSYKKSYSKQVYYQGHYQRVYRYEYYVEGGFIDYKVNKNQSKVNLDITDRIFEIEKEINSYTQDKLYIFDTCRFDNPVKGHFIMDKQYIKYELIGDSVFIDNYDLDSQYYDLSLGSIYNYDIDDYVFIPLDEIPTYDSTITADFIQPLDAEKIDASIDEYLAKQESYAYTESYTYVLFLSIDTYNTLVGKVGQSNTINGIAFDAINNVDIDPEKQYLTLNDNGEISVADIPVKEETGPHKSLGDWLRDALIVGGAYSLAFIITIGTAGAGSMVSGIIMGAAGEYMTQTFFLGKNIDEVNWGKVAVAGAFGILTGCIPAASSVGGVVLGAIGNGLISGAESVAMCLVEGIDDPGVILFQAALGAVMGAALYTAKCAFTNRTPKPEPKIEPYVPDDPTIKPLPKIQNIRHNSVVVDEMPTLQKMKNLGSDSFNAISRNNSLGKGVGNALKSTYSSSFTNVSVNSAKDTMSKTLQKSAEELFEAVFGM